MTAPLKSEGDSDNRLDDKFNQDIMHMIAGEGRISDVGAEVFEVAKEFIYL